MILDTYRLEMFNNECMPSSMSLQCFAHLGSDISQTLPYLNAALGGHEYVKQPPAVTFRMHGKLVTVHGQKIAINAMKDEDEARKIVEWLIGEINDAWEKRNEIQPCYKGMPKPKLIEILKLLPKTNCRKCGYSTCMVFASLIVEGAKDQSDCPELKAETKAKLAEYIKAFQMDY